MGADSSKGLSQTEVDHLASSTAFSGSEVREWYRKFHEDYPNGTMNAGEFKTMYDSLFPQGDSSNFTEHVFRAYDKDGNGTIDFREFLCTISVASRGTIDEKLRWAFNLYDLDGNGYVSREEAAEIVKAILKLRGDATQPGTAEEIVEAIFLKLDRDGDHRLSDMEFILGAKHSPEILALLTSNN